MSDHKQFIKQHEQLDNILTTGKRGFFTVITGRTGIIILLLALQLGLLFAGVRWLDKYYHWFAGSSTVIAAVMLIYLLNSSHNPTVKLTWSFIVAVAPIFGTLLYIFIFLDVGHRTEQRVLHKMIQETTPFFPDQNGVMESLKREDRSVYNLASYLSDHAGFPAYKNSSVKYFPLGEDKFKVMLRELEQAEHFIFLEYFIVSEGRMWNSILDILVRKATEGVEVRFMYDGTCAFSNLPYSYPKKLQALGIQCKMFAPIKPFVSTHYNNRDHRKILVVDGRTAFTGGINLADEYINEKALYGHWKDTAIMVKGEAVRSFTLMFLQMWNSTERHREYEKYLLPPEECRVPAAGYVIPYGDSPLDSEKVGEMVYLDMINNASKYIYIMSPYLILDGEMTTALTYAAKRGVDVRIILPHIPDKKYAFVLAKSHYKELVSSGVKIYEYTPGFVHAKVVLYDDTKAVVGTINFDYRSLYHHFECAAFLYGVAAIEDIKEDFRKTQKQCQAVTMETIRKEKFTTRIAGVLLKVIAPLM
ncbi:MAG: cardiolipin synthase [Oscillospiraceae bacterium]